MTTQYAMPIGPQPVQRCVLCAGPIGDTWAAPPWTVGRVCSAAQCRAESWALTQRLWDSLPLAPVAARQGVLL